MVQDNEETCETLGDLNQETDVDCSLGRVGGNSAQSYTKLLYIPSASSPAMFGKILPDFRNGNRANFAVEYHEFSVGPAMTDKRFFFSPRCWGEADALTDLFWKAIKERKKLSDNKESKDYRYWDAVSKACRPKKGAICYWIGKGESKLQYLFMKEGMADVLFGAPAKKDFTGKDVPAVPGLVKEMREMGLSPFNLKDSAGWIKLYKTGSGPTTAFHADLDQTKVEEIQANGRRKFSLEAAESAVDPAILKLDPKKITPLVEIAKSQGWSQEEIQVYIDSELTQFPSRYLRRTGGGPLSPSARPDTSGGEEVTKAVENAYEESGVEQASEDDLPF